MDPRSTHAAVGPDRSASSRPAQRPGVDGMAGPRSRSAAAKSQPRRFWRPHSDPRFAGRGDGRSHGSAGTAPRGARVVSDCNVSGGLMSAYKSSQIRTILLYSQDRRGLGHINRTLTIARHLVAAHPNLVVYVATKSAIASHFSLPERTDYIKL